MKNMCFNIEQSECSNVYGYLLIHNITLTGSCMSSCKLDAT